LRRHVGELSIVETARAKVCGLVKRGLQPNTTYYARLSGPPGFNPPTDISFTTGAGRAHLIFPADYAQQLNVTNSITFTCNSVPGALQYVLWLGTTPGGSDVGGLAGAGNNRGAAGV
jgi:hypothetical protein